MKVETSNNSRPSTLEGEDATRAEPVERAEDTAFSHSVEGMSRGTSIAAWFGEGDGAASLNRAPLGLFARDAGSSLILPDRAVREPLAVAPGFESATREALTNFLPKLFAEISAWDELRGVLYQLAVHRFRSPDEKELELVRFELRIPGLPSHMQFELWDRFSKTIEAVRRSVQKDLGSSPRGRVFRNAAPSFSAAVLPW